MLKSSDVDVKTQYNILKQSSNPYDVLIMIEMMLYSPYLDRTMFFNIMSDLINIMYEEGYISLNIYNSFKKACCDTTDHEKFNIAQQLERVTGDDNNLVTKFMTRTLLVSSKIDMINVLANYVIFPNLIERLHNNWEELFNDLYLNKDYNYPNISDLEKLKTVIARYFTV